jgi:hypothetical protein
MSEKAAPQEQPVLFPSGDLSLQEHLDLLGLSAGQLSFNSHVPESVITRAAQGGHIALPHAQKICETLAKEHGANPAHAVGIQPEHIRGLQVWRLDEKHHQLKKDDPLNKASQR